MFRIRVQLDRRQIGFLRCLLEGYNGLATTTTVDRHAGVVDLLVPAERKVEAESLLEAVKHQLGIARIDQGAS
jgi:hypothetical protein